MIITINCQYHFENIPMSFVVTSAAKYDEYHKYHKYVNDRSIVNLNSVFLPTEVANVTKNVNNTTGEFNFKWMASVYGINNHQEFIKFFPQGIYIYDHIFALYLYLRHEKDFSGPLFEYFTYLYTCKINSMHDAKLRDALTFGFTSFLRRLSYKNEIYSLCYETDDAIVVYNYLISITRDPRVKTRVDQFISTQKDYIKRAANRKPIVIR